MKQLFFLLMFFQVFIAYGQIEAAPTLKTILLEQLKTTHTQKDWFVPLNIALEGLTPEQAMWKDSSGNHSIGQLPNHLIFWNQQQLAKFKGEQPASFSGNNNETFSNFDKNSWNATVTKADSILTALEKAIEEADEAKLKSWYSIIAHISNIMLITQVKLFISANYKARGIRKKE